MLKCSVNERSDWDVGQTKMTMLKRSGVFPENWRKNDLEGVLGTKKDDLFFLPTLSLKAAEECHPLLERGRPRTKQASLEAGRLRDH